MYGARNDEKIKIKIYNIFTNKYMKTYTSQVKTKHSLIQLANFA